MTAHRERSSQRGAHGVKCAGMWAVLQPAQTLLREPQSAIPSDETFLCDSAIPLLGFGCREIKTYISTQIFTWLFRAALFIRIKMGGEIQMSSNRRMDKRILTYPYSGIPVSYQKEWRIDIHNNVDEPQHNYAVWEEPDAKRYILSYSIYIKFRKCQQIPNDRRQREWGAQGAIAGGRKKHLVVMQFII